MKTKLLAITAFIGLLGALMVISGCKKKDPASVKIESISFKSAEYTIAENDLDLNLKRELVVLPVGLIDTAAINWAVDDTNIADMVGALVEPKRPGVVNITATIQGKSATCKVTITEQPVLGIKLQPAEISDGEAYDMQASTSPENLPLTKFTWKSSDANIVQVHEGGRIKGVKPGTVTITASYGDEISSTATVTVLPIRVESVTLKPADSPRTFDDLGDKFQLEVTVKPKNATYGDVTWSSSNTSVATISQDPTKKTKYWVTCVGIGESVISATADGVTAKISVVFNAIPVSSISLTKTSHLFTKTDQTITLGATVLPSNASDKTVKWSSSNTSVATVNGGVVTCKGYGTAVITATSGSQSATCDIIAYEAGTVKDCRNNTYNTVKIGGKWWMAENMRCDMYDTQSPRAGDKLSGSNDFIDARLSGNWASNEYAGGLSYEQQQKLGYLYSYNAAIGARNNKDNPANKQGICPNGWHLPNLDEWSALCETVSGTNIYNSSNKGAKYLKTDSGWNGTGSGENLFMFSALPSGHVYYSSTHGDSPLIQGVGAEAYYWTSELQYSSYWHMYMTTGNKLYHNNSYYNRDSDKMAVRCVND